MRESILELLARAMAGVEALPTTRRADLFEAAAVLLANAPGDLQLGSAADAAAYAARSLREAEAHQLTFAALLRQTTQATASKS